MQETILIFGGAGGIGAAAGRILAEQGYRLHLVGRDAARLAAAAGATGAAFTAADVCDADAFARVSADLGEAPLAGLIYAVGTINLKPFHRLTDADFESDFAINALGAARAVRAALPALKRASGAPGIVLFSTVAVAQGFVAHASVAMAKGAIEGLTRSLAAELAPKVRVNAIAPSLVRTPLAEALVSNPQMAAGIASLHPLQRLGEPEDVARLAAFLVGPSGGWITGQVMGVDGGRSSLRTKG